MNDKPISTEEMLSCVEMTRRLNPCDCCFMNCKAVTLAIRSRLTEYDALKAEVEELLQRCAKLYNRDRDNLARLAAKEKP